MPLVDRPVAVIVKVVSEQAETTTENAVSENSGVKRSALQSDPPGAVA